MKLKFDKDQAYQLQAIESLVGLFDGQKLGQGEFVVTEDTAFMGSTVQTELGLGNQLVLDADAMLVNLNRVREANDLDPMSEAAFKENGMNFSVEMETGTGKTYVYLRAIFALHQKYGFKKFIIVVPSVAIREGTLKNLEVTREHFQSLYENVPVQSFVYDSKKANQLRGFASSNVLQIMVINIDAFRKDFSESEDEKKSNVIFKENDRLSGRRPIEFVQATNPIVIIDEPQSVDNTPNAKKAIESLNPMCKLRFSATHTNPYNLIYRLDPVRAYAMRLVKQIVVASATGKNAQNAAYVKVLEVDNKKGIRAKVRIQVQGKAKVTEKDMWVKQGSDLYELSNERAVYAHNYQVLDISAEPGNSFVDLGIGRMMLGEERGGVQEDVSDVQIEATIRKHLDKELQVKRWLASQKDNEQSAGTGAKEALDQRIKVLSLFFIDRVANYRAHDENGQPMLGKFGRLFEAHYRRLISLPQYKELDVHPVEKVHDGYFSQDKKGADKDTNGGTKDDESTYAKIMQKKEQLLSLDEPLKFIFSHSALKEGWDNPNVFQICTLNETRSVGKKRQEIGRGLRLPVNQSGMRVFDDDLNKLTVIANESYHDFAASLQKEYEVDCGVTFGKVPMGAFRRLEMVVDGGAVEVTADGSREIWNHLVRAGMLNKDGKLTAAFDPSSEGFLLSLPSGYAGLREEVVEVLQSYRIERHVKQDVPPKRLQLNKQVYLTDEFKALWDKIKHRTTYRVQYSTEELVAACVKAVKQMERIKAVEIDYREAAVEVSNKGLVAEETRARYYTRDHSGALPDIIAYVQKQTELTRKTIVRILTESGRLAEFALNPQRFMDAVSNILIRELHKLMIDGIEYEKLTIGQTEWEMRRFEEETLKEFFQDCIAVQHSVYDQVIYDSDVERRFAQALDKREDVKLFVKLPNWFKVETPVGEYNPDWAIVKVADEKLYLVRETKSTKDFMKLRNPEVDKVRCGAAHFRALGVGFEVVVESGEV